jgi:hypothetical protein
MYTLTLLVTISSCFTNTQLALPTTPQEADCFAFTTCPLYKTTYRLFWNISLESEQVLPVTSGLEPSVVINTVLRLL